MKKKILGLIMVMLLCLVALSAWAHENPKPEGLRDLGEEVSLSKEFVLENEAFKLYKPELDEGAEKLIVRGLARVFEGTIQYEFEDGHYLYEKGFVTASEGGPGWGEFEIVLDIDQVTNYTGTAMVILYEESAKDGSRLHEIYLPVKVVK